MLHQLNYSGLTTEETKNVVNAIEKGEDFYPYINAEDGQRLQFIISNHQVLAEIGCLERNWTESYLLASHFNEIPFPLIKSIFDACDRKVLQSQYPVPALPFSIQNTFSLFRGCVGEDFQQGLSWTTSLDKAIWYAAQHRDYKHYGKDGLVNCSVYVTTVTPDDIYCCFNKNELEFITYSEKFWKIIVPQKEFTLTRPR